MTTTCTRPTALRLVGAIECKDAGGKEDVELKSILLELKDEEKGEVEAVVATLGVVDKDGDVITADAVKSGSKVTMSDYAHSIVFGARPVGKGALHVEGDKAVFRGRLFLKTADGREAFAVLKEMGPDQQWSFGFVVKGVEVPDESWKKKGAYRILTKLDAFEVSPVIRGAGIGTRTLAVKSETPPPPAPPAVGDQPPTPTPEEVATKAAADKLAADTKAAEDAETKAAADRQEAERKARAQASVEDWASNARRLRRLGYIR